MLKILVLRPRVKALIQVIVYKMQAQHSVCLEEKLSLNRASTFLTAKRTAACTRMKCTALPAAILLIYAVVHQKRAFLLVRCYYRHCYSVVTNAHEKQEAIVIRNRSMHIIII